MIDLRLSESELATYTRKYAHLLPELSPQLINRMAYEHQPMPDEKPVKPEWMYTLKQRISDVEALDKAKGLLMGLAVGDAGGPLWNSRLVTVLTFTIWLAVVLSILRPRVDR